MHRIPLNEPELQCLDLFRMALSEPTLEDRMRAIGVMRHEVVSLGLENFPVRRSDLDEKGSNSSFVQWVAETAGDRYKAAHAFHEIAHRYLPKNERKLNVAEHIGKVVWESIRNRTNKGMHVKGGLLEQVSDFAKAQKVSGARDKDTLRKIWRDYRGVVHLGMAMDYCEDHPEPGQNVLHLAEKFRCGLSTNCPKGRGDPYVAGDDQISFLYITRA